MHYQYVIAAVLGYLLGCSNLAWYISKFKGVDISSKGSGNLGTSNAVILMGWKIGVLVGIHDIGKSIVAILLAKFLFPEVPYIAEITGVAAVLGHIFPFYRKFRGGKGFAAFIGMSIALNWKFAVVIVAVIVLVTIVFDYLVIGTTVTVISLPAYLAFTEGWIAAVIILVATAMIIIKHRENYIRIYNRTEIGLKSTLKGEHREK